MRKPLIMGNWKMNLLTEGVNKLSQYVNEYDANGVDVVVFPPSCYLSSVTDVCKKANKVNFFVGAQNISQYESGAHTGEISIPMIKDLGCQYSLVGHSERRAAHNETNDIILDKVRSLTSQGVKAVLCIGETLEERESSRVESVLREQLSFVLDGLTQDELERLVIAYEPVWAIGTGLAATAEQVQEVHAFIRKLVSESNLVLAKEIKIAYGGSLKLSNAQEILSLEDVDGGLIGGASLLADDFTKIIGIAKGESS